MGLLAALKLPSPPPKVSTGGAAADLNHALKAAVKSAAEVADPEAKKRYAAAIAAFDRRAKTIERMPDPARKASASVEALRDLEAARLEAMKGGPSSARKAADGVRAGLEASYRNAADAHEKLLARQKELAAELAEAKATVRDEAPQRRIAQLQAANAAEVEAAGKLRDRLYQDIETLGKEDASDAELTALVARSDPKANVAAVTTLEREDGLLKRKATTTTTGIVDGKADVARKTTEVGLGAKGLAGSRRDEREKTSADGTSKRSQEVSGKLSLDGGAVDAATSSSFTDKEGNTIGVERKGGVRLGPKAAEVSAGKTVTRRDGSGESVQAKGSVERGDGQVTATKSVQYAKTDAGGAKTDTVGATSSKTVIAGEDGYGLGAAQTGSVKRERKNGLQSGASVSFGGNVTCKIGEPKDGIYPVTMTVDFEAGLKLDGGFDKGKGGKGAVSVSASISGQKKMTVVQHVPAGQLEAYAAAVEAARGGNKLDATWPELATVYTGATRGWKVAHDTWVGGGAGGALGNREGDSVRVQDKVSRSVGAAGNFKAVKAEAELSDEHSTSTELTRTAGGGAAIETDDETSRAASGGAGVDAGAVGVMFRYGVSMSTSVGYSVTIEQAQDPDGKLLKGFMACKTPAAQEAFIRKNEGRIQLEAVTRGKSEGSSRGVEFDAGAKLKLGSSGKVSSKVKTDAKGARLESEVIGEQEVGGTLGAGDFFKIGDNRKDRAVSKRDGKGGVELDLQRDTSQSDLTGKIARKIGFGDKPEKKGQTGLLADAAGQKEEEPEDHVVEGVRFGPDDIRRVVAFAGNAFEWNHLADQAGDMKTAMAWMALGRKIASGGKADPGMVADELAGFVGADKGRRMQILLSLSRPAGGSAIGRRLEFPKSLRDKAKDYDELVLRGVADAIAERSAKEGAEAAGQWAQAQFARLQALLTAVTIATDFGSTATKTQMMRDIDERKQELLTAMRRNAGKVSQADEAEAARHDYQRLKLQLQRFRDNAEVVLVRLREAISSSGHFYGGDLKTGIDGVNELEAIYATWRQSYAKLVEVARVLKMPESASAPLLPDETEYLKFRKATGQR